MNYEFSFYLKGGFAAFCYLNEGTDKDNPSYFKLWDIDLGIDYHKNSDKRWVNKYIFKKDNINIILHNELLKLQEQNK